MNNTGIILTLAYPETIVMVADEWYSPFLRFLGVGKKNYLRAGHAALVLIDKSKGDLEYHDFGRYITKAPNGRVRGAKYDNELRFPIKAKITNNSIQNLDEILLFLANNPKLTHGDGKLIASVCNAVDYKLAKSHIVKLQRKGAIRYAAFIKEASNCARFVTTTLIESVTSAVIRKKLVKSQWFTPSTVGNVVLADTESKVYQVNGACIEEFNSTVSKLNRTYFLDKLKEHEENLVGTIQPKPVEGLHSNAKWLSGIAAGAWYEITKSAKLSDYELRVRRISPYGNVDIDAVFRFTSDFKLDEPYEVIHDSNCSYCTISQDDKIHCLEFDRLF